MPGPIGTRPVTAPNTTAPNTPTTAGGPVDVGALTREELAALKRSDPKLGNVVEQARATYAELLAATPPARLSVITSAANGGAPVLTLVPPRFDPQKPVTVQTHYHGDTSTVASADAPHTGNIKEQLLKDPQRVWVLPESLGTPGVGRTNWSGVKSEASTTRDALAGAGVSGSRFVVSGHSAGGRAIAAAMSGGTLKADQLVLLDCLYEGQNAPGAFSAILKAVKAGGLAEVKDVVVVPTGTYPPERDVQLLAAAGGKAHLEKFVPRPGLSNHNAAARSNLVPRASW